MFSALFVIFGLGGCVVLSVAVIAAVMAILGERKRSQDE